MFFQSWSDLIHMGGYGFLCVAVLWFKFYSHRGVNHSKSNGEKCGVKIR